MVNAHTGGRFDNYSDEVLNTYTPDNRDVIYCGVDDFYATIVRGTTPRHSFELPYEIVKSLRDKDGLVYKLRLTYVQGITTVLEKTQNYLEYYVAEKETDPCLVYLSLTEEETYRFQVTNPNNIVKVQLKVMLSEDEVLVSKIFKMRVLDSLNQENLGGELKDE